MLISSVLLGYIPSNNAERFHSDLHSFLWNLDISITIDDQVSKVQRKGRKLVFSVMEIF